MKVNPRLWFPLLSYSPGAKRRERDKGEGRKEFEGEEKRKSSTIPHKGVPNVSRESDKGDEGKKFPPLPKPLHSIRMLMG